MKVYIVASGSHSDYSIDAVFSSREKAETHIAGIPPEHQDHSIEEYELDAEKPHIWGTKHGVYVRRDGTAAKAWSSPCDVSHEYYQGQREGGTALSNTPDEYDRQYGSFYGWSLDSQERALEMARQERLQAMASVSGIG